MGNITNFTSVFDTFRNPDTTYFSEDLTGWDMGNALHLSFMFYGSYGNPNISTWNTSSTIDMWGLFEDTAAFNGDIGQWDTSRVVELGQTFRNASAFNQNLDLWDTSRVESLYYTFAFASSFDGEIASWDVTRVTSMVR